MSSPEDLLARRQRVLQHLMTSLEKWRGSNRVGTVTVHHLTEEEKELKHAYDLLQQEIAEAQKSVPGEFINVTC